VIEPLKNVIKRIARHFGYRVVPTQRDAMSLLHYVESLHFTAVVDVGANDGHTSAHWLKTFEDVHIHAIEAQEHYRTPLAAIAESSEGRMTVWNLAAASSDGQLTFRIHEDHPSSSSLLPSTQLSHDLMPFTRREEMVTVEARRLDAIFGRGKVELGNRVFLKLDIQGAELDALRGCEGFLDEVECVLCEVNLAQLYEGQPNLVEIIELLAKHRLRFAGVSEQYHAPSGRAIYLDAVFLREAAELNA
jgi:FkbM family methyltransferase